MAAAEDLTPPSVSSSSILSLTKSSSCGVNLGLDTLKGLQKQLNAALSSLTSSSDGLFSGIGSLGSILSTNISGLFAGIKANILPELPKIPSLSLQTQFNQLLGQLAAGADVSALIASIRLNFPSFNIQEAFNKISLGQFDLCSSIPNLNIIDGKVVELPTPCPKPTTDAKDIPKATEIPVAKDLMAVVNSAMPTAVASLKQSLAVGTEAATRQLQGLGTMSVAMTKTAEQLSDSASPIVETLRDRESEFKGIVENIEVHSAASAKISLGAINDWNALASDLGSQINAQMAKAFTPEKIDQIKEQLNPIASNLKTSTAPLLGILEQNAEKLASFTGTSETIQKALETSIATPSNSAAP